MPNHLHPNHLHDDELIALASGEGEAPKHLKDCPRCALRFKEFERTLALTTTSMPQMEWNPLQSGGSIPTSRSHSRPCERSRRAHAAKAAKP